jgi:hypothetical protein
MLLEPPRVLGSELPTPLPDGLARNGNSPLRGDFLNVAQTQGEPLLQTDVVADDFRRNPVAGIVV